MAVTVCSNTLAMVCSRLMPILMVIVRLLTEEPLMAWQLMEECNMVSKPSINNSLSMRSRFNISSNRSGQTLSCPKLHMVRSLRLLMVPNLKHMVTVMLSNNIDELSF